ncbi:hypothetical protein [Kineosporia sp. A_224]|uniref:hypothetical protein n=1 Tax=Kineosporia sp. A_224 TaxID=1962180 RepID=UPI00117A39AB|nr:hypothetical protein [Kineosporia sp. A_224]
MTMCLTPAGCALEVVDSVWADLADQIRTAAGAMLTDLFGWWTATGTTSVDQPVLHTASTFVLTWIALPVAVLALLATVGWGLLSGTQDWVRNVVRGSLVFGATASASIVVVALLQDWSESLAAGVLDAVPTKDLGGRLVTVLTLPGVTPAEVAFWSSLMLLVGALQWLLMLFRDGAVLVLTAMLPLAAAGQFAQASRTWLPRILGWQLALIFFKPAAALIYWLGLSLLGRSTGVQNVAVALVMLVTATVALPTLLRLVTFAVDGMPEGQRGLSSVATVVGMGATAAQLLATRGASAGGSAAGSGAGAAGPSGAATAAAPAPVGARSLAAGAIRPAGASSSGGAGTPSGTAAGTPVATSTPGGSAGARAAGPPPGAPPDSTAGPSGSTPPGTSGGPR